MSLLSLTFISKAIQIKKFHCNGLEKYILFEGMKEMGDFNTWTSSKRSIILRNYSNVNLLWLDKDPALDSHCKSSFVDICENMLIFELVKFCSAQDFIIWNGLVKWPNYFQMNCIHGLGSTLVDYVISNISLYNKMINIDILILVILNLIIDLEL